MTLLPFSFVLLIRIPLKVPNLVIGESLPVCEVVWLLAACVSKQRMNPEHLTLCLKI